RLFAATLLHLKLRPLPRASASFALRCEGREQALARFLELRALAAPPARLALALDRGQASVHGTIEGGARFVDAQVESLGRSVVDTPVPAHVQPGSGPEVVSGLLRPSRAGRLLSLVPPRASFVLDGGGRFEAALGSAESDALLAELPRLEAAGELRVA